jgi:hypothetical protein
VAQGGGRMTERQCERCKIVTIIDSFHRVCWDCFCELDLKEYEEELFLQFLKEEEE